MKIKKLEITGFKSFKDKTVIHFDADITAIVGPNGCGKSNIVDALQWVMGEMSAKGLRGSSMEDVIFQGSQGHVPGGLAEVSLTLENDGQFFPAPYLQYSEICITRRLHRSGQSEYLIQQEPVRLKDIHEIFMDTGAGSKGFSLIEQGAISRLVTAKPEDMRVIIEEASGVTKFKARKKESQRKLLTTEENLTRLGDIMNELQRQLSALERQSQKASRYKKLQDKIEKQDLLICSRNFLNLEEKYISNQSSLQELKDSDLEYQSKIAEQEKQKEAKKLWQLECEKKLESQQQSIEETKLAIRTKEKIIQGLEFQIEQSQKQESLHSDMSSEVQTQKDHLQKDLQQLSLAYEDLQKKATQIESQYKTLNAQHEKDQTKLQQDQNILNEQQTALMKAHQEEAHIEAEIKSLQASQKELQIQEDTSGSLLKEMVHKNKETIKIKDNTARKLEKARQLQLSLTSDMQQFKDNQDNLLQLLTEKKQTTHQLKDNKNKITSQLSALENLYKNFEGFDQGAKEVLAWRENLTSSQKSLFIPVADVIEVSKKYELALEAVLGRHLQALLANSLEDVFKAFDFLKQNQAGRASFLNVSVQKPIDTPIENEIVIGLLKDFVVTDKKYRACIDVLLNKTAIVKSILYDLSIQYPDWTFVTLTGDVLLPKGIVIGGTPDFIDSSRLKLRREIKEIKKQSIDCEQQFIVAEDELKNHEHCLEILEKDLKQTQKDHIQQEMKVIELKKDLERASIEVTDSQLVLDKQNAVIDRLLTQKQKQEKQKQSFIKEQQTILKKKETLSSQIKSLTENISKSQSQLNNLRQKVHQLSIDSTACTQEAEGKKHQKEMLQKQMNELSQRMTRITQQREQSIAMQAEAQTTYKGEQSSLQNILTQEQEKQKIFSKTQNQYETSRSQLNTMDQQLSVLRKESNGVQMQINDLSLGANTLELKMKALVETINERYMVNLKDVAMEYKNKTSKENQVLEWKEIDWDEAEKKLETLNSQLQKMGNVNLAAIQEYEEVKNRYSFLSQQRDDLELAKKELNQVINKINKICDERFQENFESVNIRFQKVFPVLFGGGEAFMSMVELKDKEDMGIAITARPPGKRLQNVSLLSGGEKALTAVSLIFAIFLVKPSPYCVLDEVDAPLDDANVFRFNDLINEMSKHAQMILVTHNKHTMEICDKLYGVTMEEKGISKMVAVDMTKQTIAKPAVL